MRSGRTLGDVFLVRFDPMGRDLMLSGLEVDLPIADQIMQSYLEHIFHMRVPGGCMVGLRPEVSYRVRTAEGKRNQVIHLVVPLIAFLILTMQTNRSSSSSIFAGKLLDTIQIAQAYHQRAIRLKNERARAKGLRNQKRSVWHQRFCTCQLRV